MESKEFGLEYQIVHGESINQFSLHPLWFSHCLSHGESYYNMVRIRLGINLRVLVAEGHLTTSELIKENQRFQLTTYHEIIS